MKLEPETIQRPQNTSLSQYNKHVHLLPQVLNANVLYTLPLFSATTEYTQPTDRVDSDFTCAIVSSSTPATIVGSKNKVQ